MGMALSVLVSVFVYVLPSSRVNVYVYDCLLFTPALASAWDCRASLSSWETSFCSSCAWEMASIFSMAWLLAVPASSSCSLANISCRLVVGPSSPNETEDVEVKSTWFMSFSYWPRARLVRVWLELAIWVLAPCR